MFSLHVFSSTVGTSTALTNVVPAADPIAAINGNFLYPQVLTSLIGTYALGSTILRAQLQSPSLIAIQPYDILPVDANTDPASPLPIHLHPTSPIKLVTDEPVQALITSSGNNAETVAMWLSDGPITPVTGAIIKARVTATSSATGYSWQNAALTFTNALAEGTYQLVGARFEGANLIAARFVFPGATVNVRPGIICTGTASKLEINEFRNGYLGVWGTFTNRVPPTVDFMSDGSSNSVVGVLDLIKTG